MVTVLRVRAGDRVRIFTSRGDEFTARVERADPGAARVLICQECPAARSLAAHLAVAFAPPQGQRGDIVIEKGTELGADVFQPLLCERVQGPERTAAVGRVARWRRKAAEAARQCGRAAVPEVRPPVGLEDFVRAAEGELLLIASTGPAAGLWSVLGSAGPSRRPAAVTMAVGPAGGFTLREMDLAQGGGFRPVSLGPHTLRVETAAVCLLAGVVLWLGASPPAGSE
jgi:16S rRNA (uracil1498-N3)-methyltransferase